MYDTNRRNTMRHYETIHTEDARGFHIVFSVAPEDFHPRDCFDYGENELLEVCDKIDRGIYSWFCARVEAYKGGILLASDYLGGCLYDSPMHFVKESDYYCDMVDTAVQEAKNALEKLYATRQPA
jgi:hypothetical protein